MQTLIQKVHIPEGHSFACRRYETPDFETNWHLHPEMEIILITQGSGQVLVSDFIGPYQTGDVFVIPGDMPHLFKKSAGELKGSALVLQFNTCIFGDGFMALPEMKPLQMLLEKKEAFRIQGNLVTALQLLLPQLEIAQGFDRITLLLDILHKIGTSNAYIPISSSNIELSYAINPAIESIIAWSNTNYLQTIKLSEAAALAGMSIPTFCRFFKKNVKKTYFDYLQDLRIGHACRLLLGSNLAIMDICYLSGFNSWAHFSRQFKMLKKMTPSQYKIQMSRLE